MHAWCRARRAQSQDFLRRRLAGAAGDRDDLRVAAGARGAGKIFQPRCVLAAITSGAASATLSGLWVTRAAGRLGLQRRVHEIMAVAVLTLQRDEEIAGFSVRVSMERTFASMARVANRASLLPFRRWSRARSCGASRRAAAASAAFTASSRSEKGRISLPTIWPVFVALAGDNENVLRGERGDTLADSFGAVADLARGRTRLQAPRCGLRPDPRCADYRR